MQSIPRRWTLHHTQRIFHIAMFIVSMAIVASIGYGTVLVWRQATADQISQSQTVTISATVPDLNAQPATPIGGGSYSGGGTYNPPQPIGNGNSNGSKPTSSEITATLTVQPATSADTVVASEPTANGPETFVVFHNTQPVFSGHTNIPYALVKLQLHSNETIQSTTTADSQGNWSWQTPTPILQGQHTLYVQVQDPNNPKNQASTAYNFYVDFGSVAPAQPIESTTGENGNMANASNPFANGPQLPEIIIEMQQQVAVQAGSQFSIHMQFLNFGTTSQTEPVALNYTIQDPSGNILLSSPETLNIAGQGTYSKSFTVAPNVAAGEYLLIVTAQTGVVLTTASQVFAISSSPQPLLSTQSPQPNPPSPVILIVLSGIMFVLFLLIAFGEYRNIRALSKDIQAIVMVDLLRINRPKKS
jgi:hypothetical protein